MKLEQMSSKEKFSFFSWQKFKFISCLIIKVIGFSYKTILITTASMISVPLLRLEKSKNVCYDNYEVDKFYKIPVLALGIIKGCQQLARNRLLKREEVVILLNNLRLKVEVRSKFKDWKILYAVRSLNKKNLQTKCLYHWLQVFREKKIINKFRKVYHLKELVYWRHWNVAFKISRFRRHSLQKLKKRAFAGLCIYVTKLKYYNLNKVPNLF